LTALKVLVVEDDGLQAMTLEDMLEEMGCEVIASFGVLSAAARWIEDGGAPDVALLDVDVDGEQVYPVADLLAARGVPFLFTSGYGQVGERRFEAAVVLGKPINRQALLKTLRGFGLAV
jgi:CheY-like chemotaxis protein